MPGSTSFILVAVKDVCYKLVTLVTGSITVFNHVIMVVILRWTLVRFRL